MSNRRRRDGQETAPDAPHDADGRKVESDGVDDLATILPPDDGAAPIAEAVAERQADAVADGAPPVGSDASDGGSNTRSRYEIIKEKFDRLNAIRAEQKALRDEAGEIVQDIEKQQGVNRGGLAEVRKLFGLDAATIKQREESRKELFDLLIKPKIDEATAGEERE
jgi:hypothetical protein